MSDEATKPRARLFSGTQPTGDGSAHIGNYLGAFKNWLRLQAEGRFETIFCIVDHHATTVEYDPKAFPAAQLEMAVNYFASGLDPDKSIVYVQSMVPEHTELAWILNTVTMYGDLGRMTQFKDKSDDNRQNINVGLFTYPVLQAADILLFKGAVVPVGEDQVQHLELSRDIAKRWNRRFGKKFFPRPKPLLSATPRIKGLDGQAKMSKSKGNALYLLDTPDERWNRLKGAFTDPQRLRKDDPGRPEVCNVFSLHQIFSTEESVAQIDADCRTAALGCFDCKKLLGDAMEVELGPIREKANDLRTRPDDVWDMLRDGGRRARAIAQQTMVEVRERMGLPGAVDVG